MAAKSQALWLDGPELNLDILVLFDSTNCIVDVPKMTSLIEDVGKLVDSS